METILIHVTHLKRRERLQALLQAWNDGELTLDEYNRLVKREQASCPHDNHGYDSDMYDCYTWCLDCQEEL
jgi:hypothetical protein